MKKQLDFIKALFADFEEDCTDHIKARKIDPWNTFGNKDYGKTAIKRKIVMLRRELLNLSMEVDKE